MARTSTVTGTTVVYPNQRVFAFSPYYADITGTASNQLVTITFNGYTLKRYTNASNKVILPLQGLFQSWFANLEFGDARASYASKTIQKNKDIIVTIDLTPTDAVHTLNFDIIWGALQIAETEPVTQPMYYYTGYPLTLTQSNGVGLYDSNGLLSSIYYGSNFDAGGHIAANPAITSFIVKDGSSNVLKTYNIVKHDVCGESKYMRWIDNYGEYRYFMFKSGSSDMESKKGSTFNYNVLSLDEVTGDLFKGRTVQKNKSVGKALMLGEFLDDTATTHIETLLFSLKQWLYDGANWVEVIVDDMAISRKRLENKREVSVKVILPDYYTQSL